MNPILLAKAIKRLFIKVFRLAFPKPLPSLEFPSSQWDIEYSTKKWAYMGSLVELGRYSMIAGYVSYFNPRASVLEIGCGTGLLLKHLTHMPLTFYKGIDISEKAIEDARNMSAANVEFEACDGATYTDDKSYDIIIFNETLYYFNDCLTILNHYQKNLKKSGLIIVSMVVDDVSNSHWKVIEKQFHVIDRVNIKNSQEITWVCKLIQPKETYSQSSLKI